MPDTDRQRTLRLGDFDSERFWRASGLAQLPGIPDKQADKIVGVMDELLFCTCDAPGDLLLTRQPMKSAHRQYLWETGFCFANNDRPIPTVHE